MTSGRRGQWESELETENETRIGEHERCVGVGMEEEVVVEFIFDKVHDLALEFMQLG